MQNVDNIDQLGVALANAQKFNYSESIYAAYLGFDLKKDKWQYKGGLRLEQTNTLGIFDVDLPNVENDYLKLFPSFSMQYITASGNEFRLWYYRRITRPRFVIANPFQYFQTNNSVFVGNPNILPSTRHYAAAAYNFGKNFTVDIFYRNQNNPIRQLVLQDNADKTLVFKQANFKSNVSYGIDFTYDNYIANFWNTYAYLSLYDRSFRFFDDASNNLISNGKLTWSFECNNSFTLTKNKSIYLDVNFFYYSDEAIANTIREEFSALSMLARKTLWNKRASISVGVEDIFNQNSTPSNRIYSDQNNISDYRFESRLLTFGFRYKFGNTGIKSNKRNKGNEERRRL
jgi:hypothetical protein